MAEPTLSEWVKLSDEERTSLLRSWNAYAGEGGALVEQIADRFRKEYGHLTGLDVQGHGIYHGGSWVIAASRPFVFDRRVLPNRYLGVDVRDTARPPLPAEFQGQKYPHGYVWSPPNFERFVDRCFEDIRDQLGHPDMTRAEMLHALIGRPFEEHLSSCSISVKEGKIPPFE